MESSQAQQLAIWMAAALIGSSTFTTGSRAQALPDAARMPVIEGDWWQVAGVPDLGEWGEPDHEPVDFALWQAADGTWQIWSCIRHTKWPGNSRLFYGWEGQRLTDRDWAPTGIKFTGEPEYGETPGGMQAPHVVVHEGVYRMLYGDWANICLATSEDGKDFTRVIQPSGKTAVFTEGPGNNTRDVMSLWTNGLWHSYYTAYPNEQGMVWLRTTGDFKTWSESRPVAYGGQAGSDPWGAESPYVVKLAEDEYYLFRTQRYGPDDKTSVYFSTDPAYFGINEDDRYLVGILPVAAPEIIEHEGQYYIAALNPGVDGIRIAKLKWEPFERIPEPAIGRPLLDFSRYSDDSQHFRVVEGNLDPIFTRSRREPFKPYYHEFIGTAEVGQGGTDFSRQGVVESPPLTLEQDRYVLLVSGGNDSENLYVAIVGDDSGEEILRLTGQQDYPMRRHLVDVAAHKGKTVRIRVVDRSTAEPWGFITFGGIFESP